jgi:hypothetical protein
MAPLIDDHVSAKQSGRAVTALMEYALKQQQKREENELLPGKEENIWLQIAVKEVHAEAKLKPHKMCVKHWFPHALELTLRIVLSNIPLSTLVHLLFASLRRTHSESTKTSLNRRVSDSSIALSASINSKESSNRSRHAVPCSVKMRSS